MIYIIIYTGTLTVVEFTTSDEHFDGDRHLSDLASRILFSAAQCNDLSHILLKLTFSAFFRVHLFVL